MTSPPANLRITGPTPLPPSVLAAMGSQMLSHRGDEFRRLLTGVLERLRPVLGTTRLPLPFTTSGTGGLEAAVVNLVPPGGRVIAISIGHFGERFAAIAELYGANVRLLEWQPGQAADPDAVANALKEQPADAVLVTHNETSTGVLNELPALAAAVRAHSDALLLVDAVSSAGAAPIRMREWGLDAVITATQKALMAPPGLALLALSERASAAARANPRPRYFFDVARMESEVAGGSTSYTPAIPVVFALRAALDLIEAEGLDAVYERHRRIAATVRQGAEQIGLTGLADATHASPALTSLLTPDGVSATELRRRLEREHALHVNQGRGPLEDRLLRIGHMGNVDDADARRTLDALAEVLR